MRTLKCEHTVVHGTADFRGEVDLSGHSSQGFGVQKCQFDHDLVLRDGTCAGLVIFESDFKGCSPLRGLEVPTGLLEGCSFRSPPDRHSKIALVDDTRDPDRFHRSIAADFGVKFDLER